jgi:hypothetical protein
VFRCYSGQVGGCREWFLLPFATKPKPNVKCQASKPSVKRANNQASSTSATGHPLFLFEPVLLAAQSVSAAQPRTHQTSFAAALISRKLPDQAESRKQCVLWQCSAQVPMSWISNRASAGLKAALCEGLSFAKLHILWKCLSLAACFELISGLPWL